MGSYETMELQCELLSTETSLMISDTTNKWLGQFTPYLP